MRKIKAILSSSFFLSKTKKRHHAVKMQNSIAPRHVKEKYRRIKISMNIIFAVRK